MGDGTASAGDGRLPGGFGPGVVRVGGTVRRAIPARAPFVERLLRHFERHRWPGAPRFLGHADGRQVLTYVVGHAAWETVQPPDVICEASLVRVAELVREFHDLTAGTDLAGDDEVVCHNDLQPMNTIYRDLGAGRRPVAFIDWDLAAPGDRVHDVAHACSSFLALGPTVADVDEAARLISRMAAAYGLADRHRLIDTVLWWQERTWRGIGSGTDEGARRLRQLGIVEEVQADRRWTIENRQALGRYLT
jgi:hypothetical protein